MTLLGGVMFAAVGTWIVWRCGPWQPRGMNVAGLLGGATFALAGIAMLASRIHRRVAGYAGLAAVMLLVIGLHWVAFGPQALEFRRGAGPVGLRTTTPIDAHEGRRVFAIVAIGLDVMLVGGWLLGRHSLRKRARR